jgi:soluble lytic murein transglycosylase-like protein
MRRGAWGGLCIVLLGCAHAAAHATRPPAAGSPTGSVAAQRATFVRAHDAVTAGRYAEAIPLLESLCPHYAALRDYCLRDLAVSRNRVGSPDRAEAAWAQLVEEFPQSVYAPEGQLERGRLRRDAGDLTAARVLFDAARASEDGDVALRAQLELAALDASSDRIASADAAFTAIRSAAPATRLGNEAKERQRVLRAAHPELTPAGAAALDELRLLVKERDDAAARALADRLLATRPRDEQADILRARADAELDAGDVERGLATLDDLAVRFPDTPAAPAAIVRSATVLWNRDRNDAARAAYDRLRTRYPTDPHMPDALYALGRIAQSEDRPDDAVALFAQLADTYPNSPLAYEARWRIGWLRYEQGRYADAAAAFGRAAGDRDASAAPDAYYWHARALERRGDPAAAQMLYRAIMTDAPASYYAGWAERRLGRTPERGGRVSPPRPPEPVGAAPAATEPFHWTRAAELQAIGMSPLARLELRAFERTVADRPDVTAALLTAYQSVGGYRDAIRLGSARGLTDPAIFFPLAFWPEVSRQAAARGIDPLFVLALMRQESMFDPSARSSADARGLMQLLPSTAERVARNTGQPVPGSLYDPNTNIALGVAHLQQLLARYGDDRVKALAAYNGGEEALGRWIRRFGALESDEFVENITYRETRDYVKRVLGNYRRYAQTYAAH